MYLAGYGLELLLKAKVCETLDIPNLFDESFVTSLGKQVAGLDFVVASEFRKFFMVHDLAKLFLLTGLRTKFDTDKANDRTQSLMNAWSCICGAKWSEKFRYLARGEKTNIEARNFIYAINTFRVWISQN